MKKTVLLVLTLCFFSSFLYAEDSVFQKVVNVYDNFMKNERVVATVAALKAEWNSFKIWFNNLPIIKDYNESVYSDKNYKKAMQEMGSEYKPHISKRVEGTNIMKQTKKY